MGHRKIAHVSSEAKTTGWNRIRGYRKAVEEFALDDNPSLMENGSFISEASSFALEKILKANPDCKACICANDNAALGAMNYLRRTNRIPGKDFSLVGYGNFDISEALELTSVDQHVEAISRQIMFLIDEFRAKGKMPTGTYTIPTELKIRNSCVAFK
jgi:DNA-binding LacI/PurR family transcriptional regulator